MRKRRPDGALLQVPTYLGMCIETHRNASARSAFVCLSALSGTAWHRLAPSCMVEIHATCLLRPLMMLPSRLSHRRSCPLHLSACFSFPLFSPTAKPTVSCQLLPWEFLILMTAEPPRAIIAIKPSSGIRWMHSSQMAISMTDIPPPFLRCHSRPRKIKLIN